ncbi:MAG: D-alanyl-D-alanine carboxypeptidase [Bacteroidota bacterium]
MLNLILLLVQFLTVSALHAQADEVLDRLVIQNPIFEQGYTGFCLYDPLAEEYLYEYRTDHRFTPASNIKLLTFLLYQELFETDQVPALWFKDYGNRVELWGTGLPLELVAQIPFPEAEGKEILIHHPHKLDRYGSGWSYDDYNYGYVYERTSLPAFQNRLRISLDATGQLAYQPAFLKDSVIACHREEGPRLLREEAENRFKLDTSRGIPVDFEREISLRLDTHILRAMWEDIMDQRITVGNLEVPRQSPGLNMLRYPFPDSLWRHCLQESDNFWAEQLLLMCAAEQQEDLDVDALLAYAVDTLWASWSDPVQMEWVDGSGLSRYNQLSPRHMVQVLNRIQALVGMDELKSFLPANGISGTLESRFVNGRPPYIWAKTGSLRHVLALSGLIQTRSGRMLIFSFLHNHTQARSRIYYREMEKVFEYLYHRY